MDLVSRWIRALALLPSAFVYVYTLQRRVENRKRTVAGIALFLSLCALGNGIWAKNISGFEFFVKILGFLFLAGLLHQGIRLTWNASVYYGIWAFVTWQILSEVWSISSRLWGSYQTGKPWHDWGMGIFIYLVGDTLSALTIGKNMPDGGEKKIGPRQLILAVSDFAVLQVLAVMFDSLEIGTDDLRWLILYMAQLLLAITLYLQNELFKKGEMRKEIELMNLLRKKEREQYHLSKETIALINQKAHDLKHQIRALREMPKEQADKYLDEMEESVSLYEAMIQTGNETLDIILTEKSLFCRERGIALSCVADGSCLDFIDTVDLYTILGNAIDNAIEAAVKLKEQEKRQIDLMIYRRKKLLTIQLINPLEAPLVYEEGVPVTTKKDRGYHGFGLKSIKHTLKRYDGVLNIEEADGCFFVTMMIPIS
ncbi:MAG: GHKL domain-containing protein [Lachnospiraceae bacterium]|nr:GHKL domain-containing protein [Lachnospiraceae bacterium]